MGFLRDPVSVHRPPDPFWLITATFSALTEVQV